MQKKSKYNNFASIYNFMSTCREAVERHMEDGLLTSFLGQSLILQSMSYSTKFMCLSVTLLKPFPFAVWVLAPQVVRKEWGCRALGGGNAMYNTCIDSAEKDE